METTFTWKTYFIWNLFYNHHLFVCSSVWRSFRSLGLSFGGHGIFLHFSLTSVCRYWFCEFFDLMYHDHISLRLGVFWSGFCGIDVSSFGAIFRLHNCLALVSQHQHFPYLVSLVSFCRYSVVLAGVCQLVG